MGFHPQSRDNSKPGFVLTAYGWRTAAEAGEWRGALDSYVKHFTSLLELEYEAEKEAVLERVNKRSPNQLVADGTGIVGLGAEFDRNAGRITLYWEWGAVPYLSEISRGRTVLISSADGGVDVEDASKTISGEVESISSDCIVVVTQQEPQRCLVVILYERLPSGRQGAPLFWANLCDNVTGARLLLDFRADPLMEGNPPLTVTEAACSVGAIRIIQEYLPVERIRSQHIALMIKGGSPEFIATLIKHGVDVNETFSLTKLNMLKNILVAKHYVCGPSTLSSVFYHAKGSTPLMLAMLSGSFAAAELLLEAKAIVDIVRICLGPKSCAVQKHESLVLIGETGSGKQVPQFLLAAEIGSVKIAVTQLRRVAAMSVCFQLPRRGHESRRNPQGSDAVATNIAETFLTTDGANREHLQCIACRAVAVSCQLRFCTCTHSASGLKLHLCNKCACPIRLLRFGESSHTLSEVHWCRMATSSLRVGLTLFALAFLGPSAAQENGLPNGMCFEDAVAVELRKNVTSMDGESLPVTFLLGSWNSAAVTSSVIEILVSEILGYNIAIDPRSPGTSVDSIYCMLGCATWWNSTSRGCETRKIRHHINVESWYLGYTHIMNSLAEIYMDEMPVTAGDMGYPGESGGYLPAAAVDEARNATGLALEYYRSWDAAWFTPANYFTDVATATCQQLRGSGAAILAIALWFPAAGVVHVTETAEYGTEIGDDEEVQPEGHETSHEWVAWLKLCQRAPEVKVP
eukprot:s690_g16.t1